MLIIPEGALTEVTTALVAATHSTYTIAGKHYQMGTIDPATLRAAALAALSVICKIAVDTQGPGALPPQS